MQQLVKTIKINASFVELLETFSYGGGGGLLEWQEYCRFQAVNCKYEIIAKKQKKLCRKSQLPLGLMPKKYHFSRETGNGKKNAERKNE